MGGWDEVDRPRSSGNFISLQDGETRRIRIIDEDPVTTFVHKISQNIDGDEKYLTVPATKKPDEDYVDQITNRYKAQPQHHIRVAVYDEKGNVEGVKILSGGVSIFRVLKGFFKRYGDVREFDIEITRDGKGRETDYSVTVAPNSYEIDVAEWWEKAEEELPLDKILYPITPEEQQRMVEQAGIDLEYDPVEAIMEEMTVEEALAVRVPFGKKYGPEAYPPNGKKIGEILAIDAGFVDWMANNITSNDQVAAAARLAIKHMDQIEAGTMRGALSSGSKKAGKSQPAASTRPNRPAPKEAQEEANDEANEEADTGPLPEWTLRMSPADYLEKFPKGPKAPLARRHIEELDEGEPEHEVHSPPPRKTPSKTPAKTAAGKQAVKEVLAAGPGKGAKAAAEYQQRLVTEALEAFDSNEEYSEPTDIVDAIKRHGNGKTRVKDLTTEQLESLLEEIRVPA